jgi:hypothetical protein
MHHHTSSHGAGTSRWLLLALTGLLGLTWLDLRRCHARRRLERTPPAKPETLQTWEGEGGGIPSLRGQRTPGAADAAAGSPARLAAPLAD